MSMALLYRLALDISDVLSAHIKNQKNSEPSLAIFDAPLLHAPIKAACRGFCYTLSFKYIAI